MRYYFLIGHLLMQLDYLSLTFLKYAHTALADMCVCMCQRMDLYIFILKENYMDTHLHRILCSKLRMQLNRSRIAKLPDSNNICTDLDMSLSIFLSPLFFPQEIVFPFLFQSW